MTAKTPRCASYNRSDSHKKKRRRIGVAIDKDETVLAGDLALPAGGELIHFVDVV